MSKENTKHVSKKKIPLVVVDLFCGSGGLTRGFIDAGLSVVAGIDSDSACQYPYEHNNNSRFIGKNLEDVKGEDVTALYPESSIKILAGCAPCQPFSTYTHGRKSRSKDDRWRLLTSFGRLVEEVSPDCVTMENVVQLKKHTIFNTFKTKLEELGYRVTVNKVRSELYGVPQHRRRLVLFASKFGPISMIDSTHEAKSYETVRSTIGDLPALQAGEACITDPFHRTSSLSVLNLKRILSSKPGGTWRDWPEELRADCHNKASGKTYSSVYGRMTWDDPAPTITTQFFGFGNGRFGHPDQDRAISLREAALLQTFPRNYRFTPPGEQIKIKVVGRLIGNAVPPRLGYAIGRSIKKHVEKYYSE